LELVLIVKKFVFLYMLVRTVWYAKTSSYHLKITIDLIPSVLYWIFWNVLHKTVFWLYCKL